MQRRLAAIPRSFGMRAPAMLRALPISVCLAAAYVIAGGLGLTLAIPPGYATGIFLPAGLAISAMLIFGPINLPGTFVGALVLNLGVGYAIGPPLDATKLTAALVIAMASAVQALIGGAVLGKAIGHPSRLDTGRSVARFLGLSPAVCLISTSLSLAGLTVLGTVKPEQVPESWLTWWVGDTLGVLLVLPLALMFTGDARRFWRRRALYVATPMLLFFAMFVAIYVRLSSWEADQSLLEYRMRSQQFADGLQAALQEQALLLEQLGTVFATRPNPMTREDFRLVADKLLQRFPMIQAVEWAPRVSANEQERFEAAQRSELPGFTIQRTPRGEAAGAEVDEGSNLYPVTYLEPVRGNEEALGFDLASEADRRATIEKATATGQASATAPIRLVQEHEQQAGLLLIVPAASGPNGQGIVLLVLRMGTFVRDLLAPQASMITLRLVDAGRQLPLFDNIYPHRMPPAFTTTFAFGNRSYQLRTAPTALYMATHPSWESWVVLLAGAFCTGLLGALLLLATGYAQRSRELVEARTAELQAANQRLTSEIVERERAQTALLQARRMEAMGQLTGGVAHDFCSLSFWAISNCYAARSQASGRTGSSPVPSEARGAARSSLIPS